MGNDKHNKRIIDKYRTIIKTPEIARRKINHHYIKKSLTKYKYFLIQLNQIHLLKNNELLVLLTKVFNLVLAGAGGRKTSVIVARAGLIEKAQWARSEKVLVLAYGRKAAKETQERIYKYLGENSKVKSSTFHSLGLNIIGKVTKRKPSLCDISTEDDKMLSFVDQHVQNFSTENSDYAADLVSYFKNFLVPLKEKDEFATLGEYYEHLNAVNLKTLKGEKVKSWQELHIANHLYCNSIRYKYEHKYEFDTVTEKFTQYRPDFYLPQSKVYIEHFGIDKYGQPRSDFSAEEKPKILRRN